MACINIPQISNKITLSDNIVIPPDVSVSTLFEITVTDAVNTFDYFEVSFHNIKVGANPVPQIITDTFTTLTYSTTLDVWINQATNGQVSTTVEVTAYTDTCKYECSVTHFVPNIEELQDTLSCLDIEGVETTIPPKPLFGCTDPEAINYDPLAAIDNNSCIYEEVPSEIEGCTDSKATNYNPDATIENGTCIYKGILGCMNPNAVNYSTGATVNDGSCVFVTGCTDSNYTNYNPLAIVDDGSCDCSEINVFLDMSGDTIILQSGECQSWIDIEFSVSANCEIVLDYYLNNDVLLTDILNDMNISLLINDESGTSISNSTLWDFELMSKLPLLNLYGTGFCENINDILTLEKGEECPYTFRSIKENYFTKRIRLGEEFENTALTFGFQFNNLKFPLDFNIFKFTINNYCEKTEQQVTLINRQWGFDLKRKIDNKKSWVNTNINRTALKTKYNPTNENLVLNDKKINLSLKPTKFLELDVIQFLKRNKVYYSNNELNSMIDNKINVNELFTFNQHNNAIWEYYNTERCKYPSKKLTFTDIEQIEGILPPHWKDLIEQFTPATLTSEITNFVVENHVYNKDFHLYPQYILETSGSVVEETVEVNCNIFNECGVASGSTSQLTTSTVSNNHTFDSEIIITSGDTIITYLGTNNDNISEAATNICEIPIVYELIATKTIDLINFLITEVVEDISYVMFWALENSTETFNLPINLTELADNANIILGIEFTNNKCGLKRIDYYTYNKCILENVS